MRVYRIGNLFPDKIRVKLPITYYSQVSLVAANTGVWFQKGFKLNNMFPWDAANTAHQPRGWNQWATMYDRYYVVAQKVMARLTPLSGNLVTDEVAGVMATYVSKLSTAEIDGTESIEDDMERLRDTDLRGRWARWTGGPAGLSGSGPKIVKITNKFYTRQGYEAHELAEFAGLSNGTQGPSIEREFHVYLRSLTMGIGDELILEVTSTVDVVFYDTKNVDGS